MQGVPLSGGEGPLLVSYLFCHGVATNCTVVVPSVEVGEFYSRDLE